MHNEWAECELGLVPNNNRMDCNISAVGEERVGSFCTKRITSTALHS